MNMLKRFAWNEFVMGVMSVHALNLFKAEDWLFVLPLMIVLLLTILWVGNQNDD